MNVCVILRRVGCVVRGQHNAFQMGSQSHPVGLFYYYDFDDVLGHFAELCYY